MKTFYTEFSSPLGILQLRGTEFALRALYMQGQRHRPPLPADAVQDTSPLRSAREQVEDFLAGKRRAFSLPIDPRGTPFQMQVWKALLTIPYGETRSYGDIAATIGNPRASRAVGSANRNNPLSIVIPCHRVIGADGAIGGYGGGISEKRFLLALENQNRIANALPQNHAV